MADKVYAVIDTNVVVSALISKKAESYPLLVMEHLYVGNIIPVFNDEIIKEYRDVLTREKFHLNPQDVDQALKTITDCGLNVNRTAVTNEVFPDSKDIVFYEVKMSKEDAYLITGNTKHFPKKAFVVTPREMIAILRPKKDLNS
ncbi:MAG: putative toxin-antitoxin system toxin component, PIN family [Bacteroidales bacterium]|nr:putative toxin-antitoxin system toxin component, PIN family [Bacteroidales bacterium]